MILHSPEITEDVRFLLTNDAHFIRFFDTYGYALDPSTLPRRPCNFAAFVESVISQQLSVKAAATILQRVEDKLTVVNPVNLIKLSDNALRSCGLSARKVEYLKGMAHAELKGDFKPQDLEKLSDHDVIEKVTALRGFGVWTAQMILIFNLSRRDVFPSLDLGVVEGLRILRKLKVRPETTAAENYARRWQGKKTAASLLLWHANAQYKKANKRH